MAGPGSRIASADYSQIELRIMAHLSGDEALLYAFREGLDVDRASASEVFGVAVDQVSSEQRRYAKTINFCLIYGMSAFGLAKSLGIDNSAERPVINAPMQVHDELVFELPEGEIDWIRTEIPRLMAGVAELKVPLLAEVGVGGNWDEAH